MNINHSNIPEFRIVPNGDSAITLIFNAPISQELSHFIIHLATTIQKSLSDIIDDTIPAYQSLTICFQPLLISQAQLSEKLSALIHLNHAPLAVKGKTIEIPVCYSTNFAPDMQWVCQQTELTTEQIIQLHTQTEYLVHMLGFSPGFLYLGGLNKKLHCNRKPVPVSKVAAGSVGIGGQQTGIYPQATPGGWQIIGRTPKQLFKPESHSPFIASPLDTIKFVSISEAEFEQLNQTSQ
ncbi:5-oxoprolinase subunit PxpB [Aliikangiella sp. IMCC44359]|uniref:5-oxoprolinase subunit PxpB n=1 Tax=Aliikangiella sp. IMCC44359 TaxID=3459125 RepID=UPI00403ABBEE